MPFTSNKLSRSQSLNYICLAGTGSGLLRASLERLGAQHAYGLFSPDDAEWASPQAALVCYEHTSAASFDSARAHIDSISNCHPTVPIVLVGMTVSKQRKRDETLAHMADEFARDRQEIAAHIPNVTADSRISISDVYLTASAASINTQYGPWKCPTALTVSRMYLEDLEPASLTASAESVTMECWQLSQESDVHVLGKSSSSVPSRMGWDHEASSGSEGGHARQQDEAPDAIVPNSRRLRRRSSATRILEATSKGWAIVRERMSLGK